MILPQGDPGISRDPQVRAFKPYNVKLFSTLEEESGHLGHPGTSWDAANSGSVKVAVFRPMSFKVTRIGRSLENPK